MITARDVFEIWDTIPDGNHRRIRWVLSQDMLDDLAKMVPEGMESDETWTLMGRPIRVDDTVTKLGFEILF